MWQDNFFKFDKFDGQESQVQLKKHQKHKGSEGIDASYPKFPCGEAAGGNMSRFVLASWLITWRSLEGVNMIYLYNPI